ncbi:MAG: O-acetylhomoserine aminocarboxypropyltransferase/cysteine synthase [Phycisphaerae bacterium]|nr:O-acetylhomoserine aminocarboxypropyltransferase/cysteine synthase [Phycisphaerae bacterium]
MADNYNVSTKCIHSGQRPGGSGERAVPISQTTSYLFDDPNHAAGLFGLEREGFIYSRIGNPTVDVLEKRMADLDGGIGGLAFSSGMAAISAVVLNIAGAGDHVVVSSALYGGTVTLFAHTLRRLGIETTFVEPTDTEAFGRAIRDRTRLVFVESVGNPSNDVPDFQRLAEIAHKAGVPLVCDNTVMTPILFRPFEHGVDLAVYSCTKFIGGHGTSIGGMIVDSGRFDWGNGKFPELTEPDESYHGLRYLERFGAAAYLAKARCQILRDYGACLSPFNAWLFLQGLETLHLRMPQHSRNAEAVAKWLADDRRVAWVNSGSLGGHPSHERSKRYFGGWSALFGFGVEGGYNAAVRFIESVRLCSHLANIGDSKTLVIHPASTTHQQLSADERRAAGVSDDFVRISVGTEDVDDIIADLDQALTAAAKG